jgi:hypothetical protein
MVLRSGFNFSVGLLGFDANDAVVREKNTKYWSSGAGQQMREAVHKGGSFHMLKRLVFTMADFLEARITPADGSCIIHAMKMACKRLGLQWPLGQNVQEDRQLILAQLESMEVLLSQAVGSIEILKDHVQMLTEALQSPKAPLPVEIVYFVLAQM